MFPDPGAGSAERLIAAISHAHSRVLRWPVASVLPSRWGGRGHDAGTRAPWPRQRKGSVRPVPAGGPRAALWVAQAGGRRRPPWSCSCTAPSWAPASATGRSSTKGTTCPGAGATSVTGSPWPPTGVLGPALGGASQPAGTGSEDHSSPQRPQGRGRGTGVAAQQSLCPRTAGAGTSLLGKAALCLAGGDGIPQVGTRTLRPPPRKRAG